MSYITCVVDMCLKGDLLFWMRVEICMPHIQMSLRDHYVVIGNRVTAYFVFYTYHAMQVVNRMFTSHSM